MIRHGNQRTVDSALMPNTLLNLDNMYIEQRNSTFYLVTVVDFTTGYIMTRLMEKISAKLVTQFFLDLQCINGIMQMALSNNGSEMSDIFNKILTSLGIRHYKTTAYANQQNGKVKVTNRLIRKILKQLFFSYSKNNNQDISFNRFQILTTIASSIVINMPPNNSQFSRQVLYKGMSSVAKNTTLNKNVSDEDIKALMMRFSLSVEFFIGHIFSGL